MYQAHTCCVKLVTIRLIRSAPQIILHFGGDERRATRWRRDGNSVADVPPVVIVLPRWLMISRRRAGLPTDARLDTPPTALTERKKEIFFYSVKITCQCQRSMYFFQTPRDLFLSLEHKVTHIKKWYFSSSI